MELLNTILNNIVYLMQLERGKFPPFFIDNV